MSGQFVCGNAIGAVEDVAESDSAWQMDVEREWRREEREWARREENEDADEDAWGHDRLPERREVSIMDIAKPMKLKGSWSEAPTRFWLMHGATLGISREFEVVKTVRRVIALEEDHASVWANQTRVDPELDGWEVLEQEGNQWP